MHKAYYRQYRPKTFSEVVGQESIITTITAQISVGKTGHAYLFIGSRGTGKTTVSKIFARALNCESRIDENPCNVCESCISSLNDNSLDIIEMDAASNNGVDDIRELKEITKFPPAKDKYKIIIIDEVHMLSKGAFNALLKTLEEPPSYVVFILATTEPGKVPVTIISRCQRYEFRRINELVIKKFVTSILIENSISYEDTALDYIVSLSDGGLRDALSLLEQCATFSGNDINLHNVMQLLGSIPYDEYNNLLKSILNQNIASIFSILKSFFSSGIDSNVVLKGLIEFTQSELHEVYLTSKESYTIEDSFGNARLLPKRTYVQIIVNLLTEFIRVESQMRYSSFPWVALESNLVKTALNAQLDIKSSVNILEPRITEPVVENQVINNDEILELDIENVVKRWELFLLSIKKKLVSTYALMREVKPLSLENGVLKLYLNENLRILKQAIENDDNMMHIVASFREIYNLTVKVVIIDEIIDNNEETKVKDYFSQVTKPSNITIK